MGNGPKLMSDLSINDEVVTNSGHTKVQQVDYVRGSTTMLTFSSVVPSLSLTVTESHILLVHGRDSILPMPASAVEVGMEMVQADGRTFTIASRTESVHSGRWVLAAETCTAYANGLLTSTSCLDEKIAASFSLLNAKSLDHLDLDGDGKIVHPELQTRLNSIATAPIDASAIHVGALAGQYEIDMDDNGASFFAQADQDGDNVLDLTWEIN